MRSVSVTTWINFRVKRVRADLESAIRAYRALSFRGGLELADDESGGSEEAIITASLVERAAISVSSPTD